MNEIALIIEAEKFLYNEKISFVKPGKIGVVENDRVEVVFMIPEALDPDVAVVDPPDVRVWVYTKTGKVEWIYQM